MYPLGSAYSFAGENATDPTQWLNPQDVEFLWTGCDAINCTIATSTWFLPFLTQFSGPCHPACAV